MGKPWIQTVSGKAIDLARPDPSQIDPRDLIHGVAHLCRFTGHVDRFYSVAEHSVQAWMWAGRLGLPTEVCRQALAHDLHEAITGDVASPIKRVLGDTWRRFEGSVEYAVRRRLGLPRVFAPIVRRIDTSLLLVENAQLRREAPGLWAVEGFEMLPKPPTQPLACYSPDLAAFHLEAAMKAGGLL